MEWWWTQEIFGTLASNLLCDTVRVNVMPNCNHCAWSPAIWAFKMFSISSFPGYVCGTILCGYVMPLESFPTVGMKHVPAGKPAHSLSVLQSTQADGACVIHSLKYRRHNFAVMLTRRLWR